MKNLRKVLAVVLVVCMAFSFMVVASAKASADYSDAAIITNKEAVDVMSGLGIMTGADGTNWNPAGIFTREQAARVVACMLTPNADLLTVSTSRFSDVAVTRWSAKYIEYCANKGIINGRGDGTFGPTDPVTAAQFSVMMLLAMGYGKNNEFANGWEIYAIDKGIEVGILKGTANFSAPATREEIAGYAFNAMFLIWKSYDKNLDEYKNATGDPTFAGKVGLTATTGIVVGNAATGATATNIKTFTTTAGLVTEIADAATSFNAATPLSMVGQVVKVYAKGATVLSVIQKSTPVTVAKTIDTAAAYTAAFGAVVDSAKVLNYTANTFANAEATDLTGFTAGTDAAKGTYALYNGELVTYVPNSVYTLDKVDNVVTAGTTTTYQFNTLADKDSKLVVANGAVKGDIVKITQVGTLFNLEKVTTVVGKITEVGSSNGYVIVNGTKYTKSAVADGTGLGIATNYTSNYTIYLDSATTYFASVVVTETVASNVVYLTGTAYQTPGAYGTMTWYAQGVDATGKEVIFNCGTGADPVGNDEIINAAADVDVNNDAILAGFVRATVNPTTGVVAFAAYVTNTDNVAASSIGAATGLEIRNGTNYYYGTDVKFIFVSSSGATLKVQTVTGVAASKGNDLTNALVYFNNTTSTNKVISTVVVPAAYVDPALTPANIVYIPVNTLRSGTNALGNVATVYIDGVKTVITCTNADTATGGVDLDEVDDGFAAYTVTNGVYTFTGASNGAPKAIDQAVATNGIYNGYINANNAAGATVVDLVTNPLTGTPYTSVAAMESDTAAKSFTLDWVKNAAGTIITIYITAIA